MTGRTSVSYLNTKPLIPDSYIAHSSLNLRDIIGNPEDGMCN